MYGWLIIFLLEVWFRGLPLPTPLCLWWSVETTGRPIDRASTLLPSLYCQLFLERWWGRRRRKRRRETDFTFSSHSYQGQHLEHNSDKERGSVIWLRACVRACARIGTHFIGISASHMTTITCAQSIFTTKPVSSPLDGLLNQKIW